MYCIKPYSSEPHHHHQNYAEHCIRHKDVMNWVLTFTGAPNNLWFLCLMYVVCILKILLPTVVLVIFPLTNIYMVKLWEME